MKIGIDARLIQETGVGRYIRNLLRELSIQDTKNFYVIFLPPSVFDSYPLPNHRWEKRLLTVPWHSLKEQIVLPYIFAAVQLDLLHVPYFTVPVLYPGRMIVTVHDLILLHMATGKATALHPVAYFLKRLGYHLIVRLSVLRAKGIIAVSQTTKNELVSHLHVPPKKIAITLEGIDPLVVGGQVKKSPVSFPYFLYVGNVYPHKNVDFLIDVVEELSHGERAIFGKKKAKLLLIGKNDFFYTKLQQEIQRRGLEESVVHKQDVSDRDLSAYYQWALALVSPSKMEGFGLPALEALFHTCPLLVSDIPVYREMLPKHTQFVPLTSDAWKQALCALVENKKNMAGRAKGAWVSEQEEKAFWNRYSWEEMAKRTIQSYETCTRL